MSDDRDEIISVLTETANGADLIVTTGGTGFSARDVTPEATLAVIDRRADNLSELMRLAGKEKTISAYLSRGVSGIKGRCLIINLPGSPKGAIESLDGVWPILPSALALLKEDPCNREDHG